MKVIDNNHLERITGGGAPLIALGIIAAIIFISGVIDGIVHPKSCEQS